MGYEGHLVVHTKDNAAGYDIYSPDKQGLLHIISKVLDDYDVVELDLEFETIN